MLMFQEVIAPDMSVPIFNDGLKNVELSEAVPVKSAAGDGYVIDNALVFAVTSVFA
jgi:hypothetical protein